METLAQGITYSRYVRFLYLHHNFEIVIINLLIQLPEIKEVEKYYL